MGWFGVGRVMLSDFRFVWLHDSATLHYSSLYIPLLSLFLGHPPTYLPFLPLLYLQPRVVCLCFYLSTRTCVFSYYYFSARVGIVSSFDIPDIACASGLVWVLIILERCLWMT